MYRPLETKYTATEIIEQWYQNGAGNCTAIGAIKAAQLAFGTKPIVRVASTSPSAQSIELLDGTILEIASKEFDVARRLAKFGGDGELRENADALFAIMAKNAQKKDNDGNFDMSFGEAVESLNDGEHILEGPLWLGLEKFVIQGPYRFANVRPFVAEQDAAICWSPKHTWFASRGVHDDYGIVSTRGRTLLKGAIALNRALVGQ